MYETSRTTKDWYAPLQNAYFHSCWTCCERERSLLHNLRAIHHSRNVLFFHEPTSHCRVRNLVKAPDTQGERLIQCSSPAYFKPQCRDIWESQPATPIRTPNKLLLLSWKALHEKPTLASKIIAKWSVSLACIHYQADMDFLQTTKFTSLPKVLPNFTSYITLFDRYIS
jgi:hypothetical protein